MKEQPEVVALAASSISLDRAFNHVRCEGPAAVYDRYCFVSGMFFFSEHRTLSLPQCVTTQWGPQAVLEQDILPFKDLSTDPPLAVLTEGAIVGRAAMIEPYMGILTPERNC